MTVDTSSPSLEDRFKLIRKQSLIYISVTVSAQDDIPVGNPLNVCRCPFAGRYLSLYLTIPSRQLPLPPNLRLLTIIIIILRRSLLQSNIKWRLLQNLIPYPLVILDGTHLLGRQLCRSREQKVWECRVRFVAYVSFPKFVWCGVHLLGYAAEERGSTAAATATSSASTSSSCCHLQWVSR